MRGAAPNGYARWTRRASGRDIHAVTAPIVAEATARILDGRVRGTGAGAAGELFDASDFLRALAPARLTFAPPHRPAVQS